MVSLSAAVIVKNEEENLPRLLKSISDKFDEIVVVDTGSTDKTVEIAKSFGAKVYFKEWNGFSDARNYASSKCKGEWIWHFDADFELEDEEFEKFKNYLLALNRSDVRGISIYVKNYGLDGDVNAISHQAFIHKNDPDILWGGNIHEKLGIETVQLPVFINHYGYQKPDIQKKKAIRNLELIKKDLEIYKNSDDFEYFVKLFYIFQTYSVLAFFDKRFLDEAFIYEEEFLSYYENLKKETDSFFLDYSAYYYIHLLYQAKRYEEAYDFLKTIEKSGKKLFADLYYYKYKLEKELKTGDTKSSVIAYLDAIDASQHQIRPVFLDTLHKVPKVIDEIKDTMQEDDIVFLERRWREKRSKNLAYLLSQIYRAKDVKKYEKFIKKVIKVFDDEKMILDFALYNYEKKNFDDAKKYAGKVLAKNEKSRIANEIMGKSAFSEKDYVTAVKYLMNVVKYNQSSGVLPMLCKALEGAGFISEAKKLEKNIKEAKKNF